MREEIDFVKVKVNLGGGRRLDDNGNIVDGRLIDIVVDGGNVYIVSITYSFLVITDRRVTFFSQLDPTTGHLESLDTSAATAPAIKNTWFISTITSLLQGVFRRSIPSEDHRPVEADSIDTDSDEISAVSGASTPVEREEEGVKGKSATVKAGGKRRKGVRKGR